MDTNNLIFCSHFRVAVSINHFIAFLSLNVPTAPNNIFVPRRTSLGSFIAKRSFSNSLSEGT